MVFLYSDTNPIIFWKDGKFLRFSQQYEIGTDLFGNVYRIYYAYKNDYPQLYDNLDLWLSVDTDFETNGFWFGLVDLIGVGNTELTLADFAGLVCAPKLKSITQILPVPNGFAFFFVELKEEYQTKENVLMSVFEFEKLSIVAWALAEYIYIPVHGLDPISIEPIPVE